VVVVVVVVAVVVAVVAVVGVVLIVVAADDVDVVCPAVADIYKHTQRERERGKRAGRINLT